MVGEIKNIMKKIKKQKESWATFCWNVEIRNLLLKLKSTTEAAAQYIFDPHDCLVYIYLDSCAMSIMHMWSSKPAFGNKRVIMPIQRQWGHRYRSHVSHSCDSSDAKC